MTHRLALVLLALAALWLTACDRGPAPGEEIVETLAFGHVDGPRTPEGARLEGQVIARMALAPGAARRDRDAMRVSLRMALLKAAEDALAQGLPPTPEALASGARASLGAEGIDLRGVDSAALALPGSERRSLLAATTSTRILLVGLDGFDWDIAEPLMAAGRMPALASLTARGVRARLQTVQPILSPVIWTSIATGHEPGDHGILDFLALDAAGNSVPVTSNLRRKKAFWSVFSEAGVSVGVVGWWATWPAEPVDGFMVSDRVAYQLFNVDDTKLPSLGKVHPPALWAEVAPLVVRPTEIAASEIRASLDTSVKAPMDSQDRQLLEQLAGVLAQARTHASIGLKLHAARKPRVGAYYFESPDTTCHLFMRYAPPALPEIDPARQRRYASVVDRSYELHDHILARFIDAADKDTVIMVVSDHGFRSGLARPTHDSRVETPTAADWHERYGIFVAAGPGVRSGVEVSEASVLDLFPTMLALLGMPIAKDLDGRVLREALTDEFLAAHPPREIDTFETSEPPAKPMLAQGSAEDRAIIESLIAIGYVGSSALGPSGASGASGASGVASGGGANANAHNNAGTIHMEEGDLDAAVSEFQQAVAIAPTFAPARINLAHALVRLGRAKEAEAQLARVLAQDPSSARALSLLSSMQLQDGRLVEAERIARSAVDRDPRSAAGWFTLGQVLDRANRLEEARAALERAAALDPDNPEPLNALGNSHESRGQYTQALTFYERALKVDPTFAAAYNNLGLQYQRLGRFQDSLRTYEEGRRRLPSSSILLNNLATWHHLTAQEQLSVAGTADTASRKDDAAQARARARREADLATALYEEAQKANPLDPAPLNNLGALKGALGHPDEQLALYQRAVEIDPRYADAWHNIGLWYQERSDWAKAHESFARVLTIDPDYLMSLRLDANALLRLGRRDEALKLVSAAAERNPKSPVIVSSLGAVQDEMGLVVEACRTYRRSLALAPDQPDVDARAATLCR